MHPGLAVTHIHLKLTRSCFGLPVGGVKVKLAFNSTDVAVPEPEPEPATGTILTRATAKSEVVGGTFLGTVVDLSRVGDPEAVYTALTLYASVSLSKSFHEPEVMVPEQPGRTGSHTQVKV